LVSFLVIDHKRCPGIQTSPYPIVPFFLLSPLSPSSLYPLLTLLALFFLFYLLLFILFTSTAI
jgi:hypothetical protein